MRIICFSHLRWNFVYQRPQHLLEKASRSFPVYYIEEPVYHGGSDYLEARFAGNNVTVVVPYISQESAAGDPVKRLTHLLKEWDKDYATKFIAWFYTPMAIELLSAFEAPELIVYDCMDELSAFRFAPQNMKDYEHMLMSRADILFTGGVSLYEARKDRHPNVHVFPSSIDKAHFSKALDESRAEPEDQQKIPHPRIGFFGVLDERLDTRLLESLAQSRPDWNFIMIGPIVKIDPAALPSGDNIWYLGSKTYQALPAYLGGWDVALIPFALNESTRYISPTKTPEYLAGGVPVVSTPIHDVVDPYGINGLVNIASGPMEFETAVEGALRLKGKAEWQEKTERFLALQSWDKTWSGMLEEINRVLDAKKMNRKNEDKHV